MPASATPLPAWSRWSQWGLKARTHLAKWLAHPRAAWALVLVVLLLFLPTLGSGLLGDDFLFQEIFDGSRQVAHPASPWGLFTFSDGNLAHNLSLRAQGLAPWWVSDHARMMFWRPLSELTHALDNLLWPQHPAWMHLHSVLWYAALVWLLSQLLQQLDPEPARAQLGALMFALSPAHLLPVIWLAARNQLIAGVCIVLTLMAHHRWRSHGHRRWQVAALLGLLASLASAEAGVAAAAYLVAYACCLDTASPWWRRAASVLPYVLTVALWHHAYNAWGYGTSGLGGYLDPGRDPWVFLQALSQRLPSLVLAGLAGVTSTAYNAVPLHLRGLYTLGVLVALLALCWPTWRMGLWRHAPLRFWAVGAVLALVPVCAASPNDRLLLNADIGFSAWLGTLVAAWVSRSRRSWREQGLMPALRLSQGLAVVHLGVLPVISVVVCLTVSPIIQVASHDEPLSIGTIPPGAGRHIILLDPPNALFTGYFKAARHAQGLGSGDSLHALANAKRPLRLSVTGPRTVVIRGEQAFGDDVSRDLRRHPFTVGERTDAGPFVATVTRLGADGRADEVRFDFNAPLHDPSLLFYRWSDHGYTPCTLPEVGQAWALPAASLKPLIMRRLLGHS